MLLSSLWGGNQPLSAAMILTLTLVAAAMPVASIDLMQLTESNFTSTTSRGLWFIEFYSPQCSHCIKFAPTWEELVIKKSAELNPYGFFMAQVNCLAQGDLCDSNGVAAYPTMKLFRDGAEADQFSGKRTFDLVSDFIDSHARKPSSTSTIPSVDKPPNPKGEVLAMDAAAFATRVADGQPMFIKFYAPWCGHCKKLAPTWVELAEKLRGVVTIAEVNCDEHKSLCKKEGVPGFPQLVLYRDGEKMEYKGARTLPMMQEWMIRAVSTGIFDIGRGDLDAIVQKEPVFFLYLHTFVAPQAEIEQIEAAFKGLGVPPVYKSQDPDLFSHFHVDPQAGSVVLAVKDHMAEASTTFSLASSTLSALSSWLVAEKHPTLGELSTHNFDEIMRSSAKPVVVLGAIDQLAKREQDTLLQVAKAWHASARKVLGRPVVFVWMDNQKWTSWLKSMYGIKLTSGPSVVIVDHSKLLYYDQDAEKAPIRLDQQSIFAALADIDRGQMTAKHSENVVERMVRSFNNGFDVLVTWATRKPLFAFSLSLCLLALVLFTVRKYIIAESRYPAPHSNGYAKTQGRLD